MKKKNDRMKGIAAALLFFLLVFTLSIFLGFHYPDPPIPDVGVEIEMGGSGSSGGDQGQQSQADLESVTPAPPSPAERAYITDSRSENVYSPPATPTTKPTEKTKPVQTEPPKAKVNQNALFTKKGASDQEGTGNKEDAGSGAGDGKSSGDGTGTGTGAGSGPSFSLTGRTAKALPAPSYESDRQGKVVIEVNVDQDGNVTDAQFNSRLSNTTDLQLRNSALEAARRSKFSVKLDASVVQRGTITYLFYKLN